MLQWLKNTGIVKTICLFHNTKGFVPLEGYQLPEWLARRVDIVLGERIKKLQLALNKVEERPLPAW